MNLPGSGNGILKQLECNAVTHTVGVEKVVITHIAAPIYVNNFSALVQRFMDQVPPSPFLTIACSLLTVTKDRVIDRRTFTVPCLASA